MTKPRIWTPEEHRRMLDMRQRGLSYLAISAQFSVSKTTVSTQLSQLLCLPKPPVPPAQALRRNRGDLLPPPTAPDKPGARPCLGADCGRKLFNSAHAGNRLCPACKGRSAHRDNNPFVPG